jgi:hypothetical protein
MARDRSSDGHTVPAAVDRHHTTLLPLAAPLLSRSEKMSFGVKERNVIARILPKKIAPDTSAHGSNIATTTTEN